MGDEERRGRRKFLFLTGTPITSTHMLDFCARHGIKPVVEMFPVSQVNEALDQLRTGKGRYRAVLKNDFTA